MKETEFGEGFSPPSKTPLSQGGAAFEVLGTQIKESDGSINLHALRTVAAMLGPGFQGKRANLSGEERKNVAKELLDAWERAQIGSPPAYLVSITKGDEPSWCERKAKLFEIGEYTDKSITVRHEDLARLAQNFSYPVPVLIEHTETPLRLGYLTEVMAAGKELFGTLSLTEEADKLLEASGAKSLSLSVSPDLKEIYEVSIVANPRIESARLFCKDFRASLGRNLFWMHEAERLREQLTFQNMEAQIEGYLRKGILPPAAKEAARDLLITARTNGWEEKVIRLLESLPKFVSFGELAPSSGGANISDLEPEEREFYAQHFPNLDLNEIARRKVK